jgi:hypothetical protein
VVRQETDSEHQHERQHGLGNLFPRPHLTYLSLDEIIV